MNIPAQPENPVSLTVLTGFLGAGKTTLLNRILNGEHGLRAAVLVNDFGAINIDADLIVSVDEDIISLANGCVCCSIRDDLSAAIDDLLRLPQPPEYVILEASGVADPAGIAITFSTENYSRGISLDSIICVLDAEQIFEAPDHMQLKLAQIGAADILLLNKVDLVDEVQINKIDSWLKENFYRHRVLKTTQCTVPMEILLSSGRFSPDYAELRSTDMGDGHENQLHQPHNSCEKDECEHSEHDTTGFKTWSYETRSALALGALEQVVSKLPNNVFRCKGVLNTVDTPDRRTILQVVGKRVAFSDGGSWNQTEPTSKIVMIALDSDLDTVSLKEKLDQCLGCLVL